MLLCLFAKVTKKDPIKKKSVSFLSQSLYYIDLSLEKVC